jgi:Zn-dependent protease
MNGKALVALAGPFSNLIMAVILAIVSVLTARAAPWLSQFAGHGVLLSLYLGIFNMLPVPPLDGSKLLLEARVPMIVYVELSRVGFMLLIVAMAATDIGRWMSAWSYDAARAIFAVL